MAAADAISLIGDRDWGDIPQRSRDLSRFRSPERTHGVRRC